MSKFERDDLKTHIRVWIQLVAEKQQQAITAHNPADVSYWSHELAKLISLGQQLESGDLVLIENVWNKPVSPTLADALDMMVNKNITDRLPENKWASPFQKAFKDAIRDGTSMVHVGVDPAKEDGDLTVISKSIHESEFKKHYIGEWKPDDQGFDRRKLRDAIVKTVNLSEPTATRIVTLNRGCSVKELVYMALEYRGRQLSSPRDQKHDAQWYANHHIATVLHRVEELMMEGV